MTTPERVKKKETDHHARIIALAVVAIVAIAVLSFALHILFSPWLLVAIAVLAWIMSRPRRSHQ